MTAPLFIPRLLFCAAIFFIGLFCLARGLVLEGVLTLAIAATSICYHTTEDKLAEGIDMTTIGASAIPLLYLSVRHQNYLPIFFGAVAAKSFLNNSRQGHQSGAGLTQTQLRAQQDQSWINHFYGVHLPALGAFMSLPIFHS